MSAIDPNRIAATLLSFLYLKLICLANITSQGLFVYVNFRSFSNDIGRFIGLPRIKAFNCRSSERHNQPQIVIPCSRVNLAFVCALRIAICAADVVRTLKLVAITPRDNDILYVYLYRIIKGTGLNQFPTMHHIKLVAEVSVPQLNPTSRDQIGNKHCRNFWEAIFKDRFIFLRHRGAPLSHLFECLPLTASDWH